MAEVEQKDGSSKQKKFTIRVDFTPMVDMNMLLITFFMLCTTLSKPQTMEISMPSNDKNITEEDQTKVAASRAMNNIMPVLEVKAKRIGGATYQVPIEVKPERRQALALRWLALYSRKRGEKTMEERLANELLDASNSTGASVKKKEDMHKMAGNGGGCWRAESDAGVCHIPLSEECSALGNLFT